MKVYIVEKIAHSKMRAEDIKCGKKIRKWKWFPLTQTKKILYTEGNPRTQPAKKDKAVKTTWSVAHFP